MRMSGPSHTSGPASGSPFRTAVNGAMLELAEIKGSIFVGQSVRYDGAAVYDSLDGVKMEKRIEMPVIEDFQLGYCIGRSLAGDLPVCIYPRMDFLLLAANQLVNHLDKLPLFGWRPKVIVRTCVGQKWPLDAGPQHTQNHTKAFALMLQNVRVYEVRTSSEVAAAYKAAIARPESCLIVENPQ